MLHGGGCGILQDGAPQGGELLQGEGGDEALQDAGKEGERA